MTQDLALQLDSLERTRAVGMAVGRALEKIPGEALGGAPGETPGGISRVGPPGETPGRALCLLYGEMGAGKTTLIKSICEGLGIDPTHVISPTYTLVNIYPGRLSVYHVDLFRIEQADALLELDRDDWINPAGLTLIEWPELARPLLEGEPVLELHLTAPPDNAGRRDLRLQSESFDAVFDALRSSPR